MPPAAGLALELAAIPEGPPFVERADEHLDPPLKFERVDPLESDRDVREISSGRTAA
jgi:hypothetical protein